MGGGEVVGGSRTRPRFSVKGDRIDEAVPEMGPERNSFHLFISHAFIHLKNKTSKKNIY